MGTAQRTSEDSPILIADLVVAPGLGSLGLTFCPGKKDRDAGWDRDLDTDLRVIRDWGASVVITLIEDHEFRTLGVEALPQRVRDHGMEWLHLPIRDVDVPDERFESAWVGARRAIHARIDNGERVLIHCRGGLGRTGLVAGVILVERGCAADEAIRRVRDVRRHAIETVPQEDYVRRAAARRGGA
ncbi:MAG: cyclin-dependent kinase inhibitor 3 family protein [Burkholderiaceae bacterium]|nr:cyclin-dependent kinase inhibitor 3 family protein [Burkholderiaceae bacterium]